MTKTAKILISIFLSAAFAVAIGFVFRFRAEADRYRRAYELSYRRALTELTGCVAEIDAGLAKSVYAQSPSMLVTLATDICRHAETAKNALSALPTSDIALEKTAVFLSQVGDFSLTLARNAARETALSEKERAELATLNDTASMIAAELDALYAVSAATDFFDVSAQEVLAAEAERTSAFAVGIRSMESALPESPVLIYDGPYSGHITQAVPQYLQTGGQEIDAAEARRVAARFLGVSPDTLHLAGKTAEPVVFAFESDELTVSVTAIGGHVISYSQSTVGGEARVAPVEAVKTAHHFLTARGFADMTESYYYAANGILYINFEYTDNGVTVYPDLIQVGVALDSGKVTYFQAVGYWNNHRSRTDTVAAISHEEARSKLSPSLTLQSEGRLCIIPSPGKHELLCYEFRATGDNNKQYLCYINAHSGLEETIFVLIEDENGVLTF